MKIKLLFPILLILSIVFIAGCTAPAPKEEAREPSLTVQDQKIEGDTVTIESLYLDKPGFVVIHADVQGTSGNILGVSNFVAGAKQAASGFVTNLKAPVGTDTTKTGTKVHAMLHYDIDGDGLYTSVDEAAPVKVDGAIIVKTINIIDATSKTFTVEMTSSGFSPKDITIKSGDTVNFVNKDTVQRWPASAVHPTHAVYPEGGGCIGSKFDACKGLNTGESWSFMFNKAGNWKYHDHLIPSMFGSITVQD